MDRKILLTIIAGLVVTCLLLLVSIYAAGIAFILFIVLVMCQLIMQDSASRPDIMVELRDDAKAVLIRNSGNSDAVRVHVALVPLDIEYDIMVLAPDQINEYPLEKMVTEAKAVATFENVMGDKFSRSGTLASGGSAYDPLKPMIPIFRWK